MPGTEGEDPDLHHSGGTKRTMPCVDASLGVVSAVPRGPGCGGGEQPDSFSQERELSPAAASPEGEGGKGVPGRRGCVCKGRE